MFHSYKLNWITIQGYKKTGKWGIPYTKQMSESNCLLAWVYSDHTDFYSLFGFSIINNRGSRWTSLYISKGNGSSTGKELLECFNSILASLPQLMTGFWGEKEGNKLSVLRVFSKLEVEVFSGASSPVSWDT